MSNGILVIVFCLAGIFLIVLAGAFRRRSLFPSRRASGGGPGRPLTAGRAMETLGQATERLTREGFDDCFRVEGPQLHALKADRSYRPEDLRVDACVRFEGESDPADESVIFALHADDGVRGTFVSSYGPAVERAAADILPRLARAERTHAAAERAASRVH